MPFANSQNSNNAVCHFSVGVSASATTWILQAGEGALLPSVFPYYLTGEKFDTVNPSLVTKREIVKVTGRSGDTLTIVRGAGYCPANSTALTQTNTQFAFDSGDQITLSLTAEQIKDVSDELVRHESAKLDISALQANSKIFGTSTTGNDSYAITLSPAPAALTVGMVVYLLTDVANTGPATLNVNGLGAKNILKQKNLALVDGDIGSNHIIQLSYDGTQWQMLSQVANTPTVDVHGQIAKSAPIGTDEIMISDSEASWANKKITLSQILAPIGGNGSDGALSISSGTTTIPFDSNGYAEKNYTTVNISGSATLTFSGPLTNGSIAYIKCQRFVMTGGTISVAGFGGAAGALGGTGTGGSGGQGFNLLKTNTTNFGVGGGGSGGAGGAGVGHFGGYIQGYCGAGGGGSGMGASGSSGSTGGAGGGLLIIEAKEYFNASSGTLTAAGAVGGATNTSGGGGGGGGAIFIISPNIVSNAVTKNVNGGNGGNATSIGNFSNGGGGGGGGYSAGGAGGNGNVSGTAGTTNTWGSGGTGGTGFAGGTPSGGGGGGGAGFYKVN